MDSLPAAMSFNSMGTSQQAGPIVQMILHFPWISAGSNGFRRTQNERLEKPSPAADSRVIKFARVAGSSNSLATRLIEMI